MVTKQNNKEALLEKNGEDKQVFKIKTLNKIAAEGLACFDLERYEIGSEMSNPHAIILRSYKMNDYELPPSLLAVGRAGIGINNIAIDQCSEKGIVVMNTPGANANAVKELAILSLLITSRGVVEGIEYVKTLKGQGENVPSLVEENKKKFAGQEISGKVLGIIGLGKIGVMLANSALALGMKVVGYDPFISVESAWGLSREVERAEGLDRLVASADYISLNTPLTAATRSLINYEKLSRMKKGVRIINLSRGGIVHNEDLKRAIDNDIVGSYVTDFPDAELLDMERVICIPHLGASTEEAESNCARMIAKQIQNYLEWGNIKNSVNFPNCSLEPNSKFRLVIANRNIPNMVGQISTILAREDINIVEMLNKSREDVAYNIIDISKPAAEKILEEFRRIKGVIMVRFLDLRTS